MPAPREGATSGYQAMRWSARSRCATNSSPSPDRVASYAAAASAICGITQLSDEAAKDYVRRLAKAYLTDTNHRWWWEAVSGPTKRIPYGDADGLSLIAGLVGAACAAHLVITDDEDPPWPVYAGGVGGLLAMLRDCRFCEYFLVAQDGSWIVFDTHMNELVVVGQLAA